MRERHTIVCDGFHNGFQCYLILLNPHLGGQTLKVHQCAAAILFQWKGHRFLSSVSGRRLLGPCVYPSEGPFLNAVPSIRCRRHTLSGDNVKIFLGEGPALFFFSILILLPFFVLFGCLFVGIFIVNRTRDQSTVSGSFSLMLSRFYLIDFFYIFSYYHQTKIEKKKKLQQSHSNVRLGGPTTISLFFSFFSLNINMYYQFIFFSL